MSDTDTADANAIRFPMNDDEGTQQRAPSARHRENSATGSGPAAIAVYEE